MALDPSYAFYSEGTISLVNGSDIATGAFVAWDPAVLPFDFVFPNDGASGMGVIKEVLAMDQIRLAKPWTGPTLADVPYFMVRWTKHTDPKVYALRLSDYLTRLKAIPENIEELAAQITTDAATVAAALATITQAASDVEADRQAVDIAAAGIETAQIVVLDARDEAVEARDVAVSAAGSTQALWDSRAAGLVANIPAPVQYLRTAGYATPGDGGGALYKRIAAPGSPKPWHFQSADGAWWEMANLADVTTAAFGAVENIYVNSAAAIQAAIDAVASVGGGTVHVGNHGIGATLSITKHHVKLKGKGGGQWHDGGAAGEPEITAASQLLWLGAAGGTMIKIEPAAGSQQGLRGCGVTGLFLNSNATAAYGLFVLSSSNGVIDIATREFSQAGLYLGCKTGLAEAADTMMNTISVIGRQVETAGTVLTCDGISTANTCFNHFINVRGAHKNNVAVWLKNCDNNIYHVLAMFRVSGGTGFGLQLEGAGIGEQHARCETFLKCGAVVYARGTEVWPAPTYGHVILLLDKENGQPDPVIGTGAGLTWGSNFAPIEFRAFTRGPTTTKIHSNGYIEMCGITTLLPANTLTQVTYPTALPNLATFATTTPLDGPHTPTLFVESGRMFINPGATPCRYYWKVEGY